MYVRKTKHYKQLFFKASILFLLFMIVDVGLKQKSYVKVVLIIEMYSGMVCIRGHHVSLLTQE